MNREAYGPNELTRMAGRVVIVLALILVVAYWSLRPLPARTYPPGVQVQESPVTTPIHEGKAWNCNHYLITPLATYELRGRVLSITRYYTGRETDLSPYDIAVGWGCMSDQKVLDVLTIGQSDRWYTYSWPDKPPAPEVDMADDSKNMRIIPATPQIIDVLKLLRQGDLFRLSGQLVNVKASDGWSWESGLDDHQTGAHSCKLIWTERLVPDNP